MEQGMNKYYCSLKPGHVIEGRYRILRPKKVKLDVRDLKYGRKLDMSFPLCPTSHPLPQESHYCQIVQINEKNGLVSVTLLEDGGDGEKGSWRKFPLSCEEDIQSIKDGLKKDDHEVFCTIVKILGKEVLGDIQCLPKDPPILKLPAEIFCMICHHLENDDLLSLRLVCSTLANNFLPMDKSWEIATLSIDADHMYTHLVNNIGKEFSIRWGTRADFTPPHRWVLNKKGCYDVIPQPLTEVNVKWLNTTQELTLGLSLLVHCPYYWEIIINNCSNLEVLEVQGFTDEVVSTCLDEKKMDKIYSQLLSKNKGSLKKFEVFVRHGNFNPAILSSCGQLNKIKVFLGNNGTLVNFESLQTFKNTLRSLYIARLKNHITKDQLVWIAKNLKNLETLKARVVHDCERKDERYESNEDGDEGDEHTLISIVGVDGLPKLRKMRLHFYSYCDEEDGSTKRACPEADRIVKEFKRLYPQQNLWDCEYFRDEYPTRKGSIIKCIRRT